MNTLKLEMQSKEAESQHIADQLAALEKTGPAVKAEYNRIDTECIVLAGQLHIAQLAGSAQCPAIEGALVARRQQRDRAKAAYGRQRDDLLRRAQELAGPVTQAAADEFLSLAQNPPAAHEVSFRDGDSGGYRATFARTNRAALARFQKLALKAAQVMRDMRTRPIRQIEEAAYGFRRQLASIDLRVTVEDVVTQNEVLDLREWERVETPVWAHAWAAGAGGVIGQGGVPDSITAHEQFTFKVDSALKAHKEGRL